MIIDTLPALGLVLASTASASDPWKALGAPAAVVAVITLLSYLVGLIKPVAIKQPRYWTRDGTTGPVTELSFTVKNRKINVDRTLTGLALVRVPPLWRRLLRPNWRRNHTDPRAFTLRGDILGEIRKRTAKIGKGDDLRVQCRIIPPGRHALDPDEKVPREVRLLAYFGSSRPAMKRPKLLRISSG